MTAAEVTHRCPADGEGTMPCCGRTPFEARDDRMTMIPENVTCTDKTTRPADDEACIHVGCQRTSDGINIQHSKTAYEHRDVVTSASFNQPAFAAAVSAVIAARGLSDRQAADQAGLAASTITRCIRQDHCPSVDNLAVLADWAHLPVDAFIVRTREVATPLAGDTRRVIAAMLASEAASQALALLLEPATGG